MITWSSIDWLQIIGGLGLFLFGIKYMGEGLKNLCGQRLRELIDQYTSKPLYGILIGCLITCVIQSSSATTAIAIGLIRVGLMRLDQAAGIMMGANIGTTITAFLIGLKVEESALWFVFFGSCLVMFANRKKYNYIGEICLGFGVLFFGLKLMADELRLVKDIVQFQQFATQMSSQPFLAMLAGVIMTAIIQSSSATVGIAQKIYEVGGMSITAAIPFVLGANIGTTITAFLASIGGSLEARRAAGLHTMIKFIGAVIAFTLLTPFVGYVLWLTSLWNLNPSMQIASAHITFNIISTIVFYPFIKQLIQMIKILMPGEESQRVEVNIDDLNIGLIKQLPSSALEASKQVIMKMGDCALQALDHTQQFFNTGNSNHRDIALQMEDIINSLDTKLTAFLTTIARENLSECDIDQYGINMQLVKNLERVGDLTTNLTEFFDMVVESREAFSQFAKQEMNSMFELVNVMLGQALKIYDLQDEKLLETIQLLEDQLDIIEVEARKNHFNRMRTNECNSPVAGSVYVDCLATLERIGDHAINIAQTVVDYGNVKH